MVLATYPKRSLVLELSSNKHPELLAERFLICPDEGFIAETLTEILKIYIHNDSVVVGISSLNHSGRDS